MSNTAFPNGTSSASPDYTSAAARSRADRSASNDALALLEGALAAPTPTRERAWRDEVVERLDAFIVALDEQAETDLGDTSLLNEIAADHPRLHSRVMQLHAEHRDLRDSASSLRGQITGHDGTDTADIRDRLAGLAHRFRRHRARESDLVYEAINLDLGAGD